jgi:hypothetical protein
LFRLVAGKKALTAKETSKITQCGKIAIFRKRPVLDALVGKVMASFEGVSNAADIGRDARASWCMLYCGGSKKIEESLRTTAHSYGIGWQSELFDW